MYYIQDPSGVFSVCNAREWHIDKFPPFIVAVLKMAANSRFVELNKKTKQVDASKHFKLSMYLLVFLTCCEICCVLYLVLASAVLVRKLFFTMKTLIFIVIEYYCVTVKAHIINRTSHGSSKIWMLCSRVHILFLPLEHKIHIYSQPCNILYILAGILSINSMFSTSVLVQYTFSLATP